MRGIFNSGASLFYRHRRNRGDSRMVSAGFNLSPSGSVSLDKKLVYGKESILVSFKVSYIYIYIYIYICIYIYKVDLVLDRKIYACLT